MLKIFQEDSTSPSKVLLTLIINFNIVAGKTFFLYVLIWGQEKKSNNRMSTLI